MVDREHLIQRYSDLLEPDFDDELLQVVATLDDAAAPYRRIEPPVELDTAVLGLTRQPRAASGNGHVASPTDLDTIAASDTRTPRLTRLRTGWLRQSLGMVAAVLVLVLVAGVLAVTFGNLGQGQQGGLGGGATATSITDPELVSLQATVGFQVYAPTWLPDSWTLQSTDRPFNANGYSQIQLRYADAGHTQGITVMESWPLHLDSLSIPPYVTKNARPIDLGSARTGYIFHQADSIALWWQEGDVAIQFQTGLAGPQAPPDQRTPPTHLITEEEVIRIARSMVPVAQTSSATPSTTHGPLTFEQAQQAAQFYVVQPTWLPSYVVAQGVDTAPHGDPTHPPTSIQGITLYYGQVDPRKPLLLQIDEIIGDTAVSVPGTPSISTITIEGHEITRTASTTGNAMVFFKWQDQGTTFMLTVRIADPDVTEQDIEKLIASMLAQGNVSSSPTPDRTNFRDGLTVAQAQPLVAFPIVKPNWTPNTISPSPSVMVNTVGATGSTKANLVFMSYDGPNPEQATTSSAYITGVDLEETTATNLMPTVDGNTLHVKGIWGQDNAITLSHWNQSSLSIGGVSVTKLVTVQGNVPVTYYQWQQNGVYFLAYTTLNNPVTEQDIEHIIASMLDPSGQPQRTYTYPSPTSIATPAMLPLSQEDSVWRQVMQAVNTGIDPILKPAHLPNGIDSIQIVSAHAADSGNNIPAVFDVQYAGPGKRLDIVVGVLSPSLCGSGCTQSQIAVRGRQATLQVNDAVPGHMSLWWSEPGMWKSATGQPPGIAYWIFAQGLSSDDVQQVAASLTPQASHVSAAPTTPATSDVSPVQPLLTPSAKLPTKEAAAQWAIDYASRFDHPAPRVIQANLMTLADEMGQGADLGWTESVPRPADETTPVWVVEVEGAEVGFVCPHGFKQCDLTHVNLVANAQTGEFVGMYLPPSSLGTPTS